MGINKENYVDQAEQVIKNLMTDRKGNITLTTSFILRESGTNSIFEIADCV